MLAAHLLLALASATPAQLVSLSMAYPPGELVKGAAGEVGFEVELTASGKATACRVTASSGFPGLDAATCDQLRSSGKFKPAKDEGGKAIPSVYTGKLRWKLPITPPPAAK